MMLFDVYLMLLWLVHVYETQKCMMTIVGLVHTKCIKHTQLIIRLVHLIIVGVSTWNCMVMCTHKIGILNAACYNGRANTRSGLTHSAGKKLEEWVNRLILLDVANSFIIKSELTDTIVLMLVLALV